MKLITILRWLGLKSCGRAVCGWCQKDLGRRVLLAPDQTSHGICSACEETHFGSAAMAKLKAQLSATPVADVPAPKQRVKHQRRSRRTLRRVLGGWGGAVAS